MAATRDNRIPVTIDLEDGDSVQLITWDFIVDKMDKILGNNIIPDLANINSDLNEINTTLKEWIDKQV